MCSSDLSDYGVTVPDLPGCFSAGETLDEAIIQAEEAILTHIEGMLIDGETIPTPSAIEEYKKHHQERNYIWALAEIDISLLSDRVQRVNITITEKLLTKIDSFAAKEGESRSGFLSHAALEYMSNHSDR